MNPQDGGGGVERGGGGRGWSVRGKEGDRGRKKRGRSVNFSSLPSPSSGDVRYLLRSSGVLCPHTCYIQIASLAANIRKQLKVAVHDKPFLKAMLFFKRKSLVGTDPGFKREKLH
jgi:hypothetical protein